MLPLQPLVVSVPLPLAMGTPPQQKLKSPVCALTSTTLPALVSSCRQKLNATTGKAHCVVLFDPSVAVQVTVVVPTGNIDPAGGLHTTVGAGGQLSVAVGVVKLTSALIAKGHEACAVTVIGAAQPFGNTGASVSFTVTVKLQVALLPTPFEAVHITVVTPFGNTLPDEGVQVTVGCGTPPAVTVKLTIAEHAPAVVFATTGWVGQFIAGWTPIVIVTSANESGQGEFVIVHRTTIGPAPPV
jgi:hypothetical protein